MILHPTHLYSSSKSATQNATVKSAHATVAPRLPEDDEELDSGAGVPNVGAGDGAGVTSLLGAGVISDDVVASTNLERACTRACGGGTGGGGVALLSLERLISSLEISNVSSLYSDTCSPYQIYR